MPELSRFYGIIVRMFFGDQRLRSSTSSAQSSSRGCGWMVSSSTEAFVPDARRIQRTKCSAQVRGMPVATTNGAIAAMASASALGLTVDDAVVLHASNRLTLRLMPCDVVARVAPTAYQASAEFEVELAQRLAETDSPVAALEPRVEPRVYGRDGFAINMWTYYEPVQSREVAPADYAHALQRLHAGMQQTDVRMPHFTDRVAGAERLLGSRDHTPELSDADWELLSDTLASLRQSICDRGAAEQLLHGEPHPGNLLRTKHGPIFIDFETCCLGPVEFDIAHAPEEVSEHYPRADQQLIRECRALALAMVTTWRWDRDDRCPNRRQAAREFLSEMRTALERCTDTP